MAERGTVARSTIEESAESLARLLDAIDRGEVEAPAESRHRIEGALMALRALLGEQVDPPEP